MSGGRFTKSIPEYIYFIGEDGNWVYGPYVKPKKGFINRKFKITEVPMDEEKKNKNKQ